MRVWTASISPWTRWTVSITRRLRGVIAWATSWEGIEAAARVGLSPIKVNTLVLRGMNEADLPDLVDYCLDRGIELRVIEQMPIGPVDTWDRQNILTADEILHIMGTRHTLDPAQREDPHSPAGRWIVDGDPTKRLGVIASVSDPFLQCL